MNNVDFTLDDILQELNKEYLVILECERQNIYF